MVSFRTLLKEGKIFCGVPGGRYLDVEASVMTSRKVGARDTSAKDFRWEKVCVDCECISKGIG